MIIDTPVLIGGSKPHIAHPLVNKPEHVYFINTVLLSGSFRDQIVFHMFVSLYYLTEHVCKLWTGLHEKLTLSMSILATCLSSIFAYK